MQDVEVISLGCRLNAHEGDAMRRRAAEAGLGRAVIVNSCAVTNEAVRQTRQAIRKARRADPAARIIVTGCAAQIDPAAFAAMPEVDAVLGNQEKLKVAEWRRVATGDVLRVDDIMQARETAHHLIDGYGERARAFLQVQNGCDHRCTFCIIPYGRGNSRSTPQDVVVDAAKRLVDEGHAEIVLTGVDMTSWGADLPGAPRLGDLVAAILDGAPALLRLRLSSIDGAEVDDALFERIVSDTRVAPHLHLSLQSGDDMILKRMKRRHTRAGAIDLCARIRRERPQIAFGADIIAGFPTETDAMFENSLSLIGEAGLAFVHAFPFSPRAGTPAARMPLLPQDVVRERARTLRAAGEAATAQFLEALVGSEQLAVMESGGRARLGNFAVAKVEATARPGEAVRLRISARDGLMLRAETISAKAA